MLTWPQGNGWLTQQLVQPLGERLLTGQVVLRIATGKHGVEADVYDSTSRQIERWQAEHCIVCLPLFVAARVIDPAPPALLAAAQQLRYASWLVANIHIKTALHDRPGAAPSWDNVIYTPWPNAGDGLGYVDAMHQALIAVPGATVLTHYKAFGIALAAHYKLLNASWASWRNTVVAELSVPPPDLADKATRIDIMRYGHAMSTPVPGIRSSVALQALQTRAVGQRLHFAHGDLAGYSVFEEAFTQGYRQATALAGGI